MSAKVYHIQSKFFVATLCQRNQEHKQVHRVEASHVVNSGTDIYADLIIRFQPLEGRKICRLCLKKLAQEIRKRLVEKV